MQIVAGTRRNTAAHDLARPVAVSEAVRAQYSGPATSVEVIAAFPAAVHLRIAAGRLLAVVTADAALLPIAAVLGCPARDRPFAAVRSGDVGTVGAGRLSLPGLSVYAVRWWNPRPTLLPARTDLLAAAAAELRRLTADADLGLPARALAGTVPALLAALRRADVEAAVDAAAGLVGLGPGLTPAGDDLLAGLLSTLVCLDHRSGAAAAARIAAAASGQTSELSWALLAQAALGHCTGEQAALLHAARAGQGFSDAYHRLAELGHTSGAALATGAGLGLDLVVADRAGSG